MEECSEVFFYVFGLLVIDIVFGYDYIIFVIGVVMVGWYGMVMFCYVMLKEYFGLFNVEDVCEGLIVYKIVVYVVDIVCYCFGVCDWDDEFSCVCYNFDWNKQFELFLDFEWVKEYYDEILLVDIYKQVEFCFMCGLKYCLMQIKIIDEDFEGFEKVFEIKVGVVEFIVVKFDKVD